MTRKTILLISGILVAIIIAWQMSLATNKTVNPKIPITNSIDKSNQQQVLAQTGILYVLSIISHNKP